MTWKEKIVEQYGQEYIFRQLAEESAELTQEARFKIKAIRAEKEKRMRERMLEE